LFLVPFRRRVTIAGGKAEEAGSRQRCETARRLACRIAKDLLFDRLGFVPQRRLFVAENVAHHALSDRAAFQLANVTKTPPQYGAITPRWLVRLLDWKPLEAGTLRVNRLADNKAIDVVCGQKDEKALPETFVDYEEKSREYTLCGISAVLDVHTRVSDLYSNPSNAK
jgi:hypothetical protein